MPSLKSWKTVLLLSAIIPISLLAIFRLANILHEPLTISETHILDTVEWEIERPYFDFHIMDHIKGYSEGEISFTSEVEIFKFCIGDPFYHSDYVIIYINATAVLQAGFVSTVNFTFWEGYENSDIDLFGGDNKPRFHSLSNNMVFTGYVHYLIPRKGLKAAVEFTGVNQPKNVSIDGEVEWLLRSPANRTSLIQMNVEITYYNGTFLKKIIQPFQLKISSDNNDSFDTAQEIHFGYYPRMLLCPPLEFSGDYSDYYKIYLINGQTVNITVDAIRSYSFPDFRVYVYNPEKKTVMSSESQTPLYFENFAFTTNSTGFWFIEVRIFGNSGAYFMEIDS